MSKQTTEPISSAVMDQIKSGKLHMKPRVYYVLLGVVSGAAIVLAGLSMTYLTSIVFLWLRIQTANTMAWGARAKLSTAIASFPWWALVLSLILLVVAVLLVRHQGRMYRHKTGTIALVIITCALLLGFGLSFLNVGKLHTSGRPIQSQSQGWHRTHN